MKTHTLKLFVAFLIGALLATLITLYLTGDYTRRLEVEEAQSAERAQRWYAYKTAQKRLQVDSD